VGSPNERVALLSATGCVRIRRRGPACSAFKRSLADAVPDLDTHAEVKDPVVDLVIAAAEPWASETEWSA